MWLVNKPIVFDRNIRETKVFLNFQPNLYHQCDMSFLKYAFFLLDILQLRKQWANYLINTPYHHLLYLLKLHGNTHFQIHQAEWVSDRLTVKSLPDSVPAAAQNTAGRPRVKDLGRSASEDAATAVFCRWIERSPYARMRGSGVAVWKRRVLANRPLSGQRR